MRLQHCLYRLLLLLLLVIVSIVGDKSNPQVSTTASNRVACAQMRDAYNVRLGSSWGSLPIDLQRHWHALHCTKLLTGLFFFLWN